MPLVSGCVESVPAFDPGSAEDELAADHQVDRLAHRFLDRRVAPADAEVPDHVEPGR